MQRVQLNLEALLPELRDLENKKIFTKAELQEIVKRRTAFETSLIRKGASEKDWLDYIEYEKRLEQLRKLRASKMKIQGRPTVSDYSIARHIVSLYSSAVTKRPGSTKLWHAYLTHVVRTSNSGPEISKALAKAIAFNPTSSAIWLLAIRFEADGTKTASGSGGVGGGNIDSARKLCMRALRFTKAGTPEDSRKIWIEWIRLEISFIERMRKRWELLGIQDAVSGNANMEDADMETAAVNDTEADEFKAGAQIADAQKQGQSAVLEGAIVEVVMNNAFAAAVGQPFIFLQVLDLLRPLPTPLRSRLLSHTHTALQSALLTMEGSQNQAVAATCSCRRFLDDLGTPAADGMSLNSVPIDSEEWIQAVGDCCREFAAASQTTPFNHLIAESYAGFLLDMGRQTEDANLRKYLGICAKRLGIVTAKASIMNERVSQAMRVLLDIP